MTFPEIQCDIPFSGMHQGNIFFLFLILIFSSDSDGEEIKD